jgi:hypothetical protein
MYLPGVVPIAAHPTQRIVMLNEVKHLREDSMNLHTLRSSLYTVNGYWDFVMQRPKGTRQRSISSRARMSDASLRLSMTKPKVVAVESIALFAGW